MKFLIKFWFWIDDFLIDCVFERFCHWFQRLTGKDNFWLAKLAVTILIVGVDITRRVILGTSSSWSIKNELISLGALSLFLFLTTYGYEMKTYKVLGGGFKNPLRTDSSFRFAPVTVCIVALFVINPAISVYAVPVLLSSWAYIVSCTPLPPSKSTFRKWIEKLTAILRPSPVPT